MSWKSDDLDFFEPEKIRIESRMYSVNYLFEMMEKGDIYLEKEFTRGLRWNGEKKSMFIESLLLRIPIQSMYLYEDNDLKYRIIDGLQRLSSISDFIMGKFALTRLNILFEKNEVYFSELTQQDKYRILQSQIQVNIIDARTPKGMLFEIFSRINLGGSQLNNQEIRNFISNSSVRGLLSDIAYMSSFREIINQTNNRLNLEEYALRYLAFYRTYKLETEIDYKKFSSLGDFLNRHLLELNRLDQYQINYYLKKVEDAVERSNSEQMLFYRKNANFRICFLVILTDMPLYDVKSSSNNFRNDLYIFENINSGSNFKSYIKLLEAVRERHMR